MSLALLYSPTLAECAVKDIVNDDLTGCTPEQIKELRTKYRIATCELTPDGEPQPEGEDKEICILEKKKACVIDENIEPLRGKEKIACIHRKRREDIELSASVFIWVLLAFVFIAVICWLVNLLKEQSCKCCNKCCRRRSDAKIGIEDDEVMAIDSSRKNQITPIPVAYE